MQGHWLRFSNIVHAVVTMNMLIYNKRIKKNVENSANFVSLITFSPKWWPPSRGSWSTIWDPLVYRNEQLIILPQGNISVQIRYTAKYIPVLHTMNHFYELITALIKRRKKRKRIPATILLRDQYVLYPPLLELVFIPFYFLQILSFLWKLSHLLHISHITW